MLLANKCSNGINGSILEDKSLTITEILLLSNSDIVGKIIELARVNGLFENNSDDKIDIELTFTIQKAKKSWL